MTDKPLSHSFSSLKMFMNCPKRYYHQRIAKEVQDQPGAATLHGERVHKSLEDYLKGDASIPSELTTLQPVCDALKDPGKRLLVEQEYTLNRNLEPTGWWDADAWMRSKLDVLVLGKSTAIVVDWKTGKRRPDFDQLELFALQVFQHHPEISKVKSTFIWTQTGQMDSETYTRDAVDVLWVRLLAKVHRIESALASGIWPAKPSGLCGWCPCKSFCEFAK